MIRPRVVAGLLVLAVAVPALHYLRGLPWPHATLGGLGFAAIAFLAVRAAQNVAAWRPRQ